MHRHALLAALSLAAVGSIAVPPAEAAAATQANQGHHARPRRVARIVKKRPCAAAPVQIVAGAQSATLALTQCDGDAIGASVQQLAALARPTAKTAHGADGKGRMDSRLVERLEKVVEHFRKDGQTPKVVLVSGYRPRSAGSFHASGRALDFRIDGAKNEEIVAFCKTLPDTGCGYYPNDSFVHIDVRDAGVGHVSWIETSRAGEPPHYVSAWPETQDTANSRLPPLPTGAHSTSEAAPALDMRRFQ
ncbi:MAG TPA: DUF882 domain-containing protein [Polyangiaceae bacterium]|nr:DUF882 domain-containing protein [Polyangiaceae bacterium]